MLRLLRYKDHKISTNQFYSIAQLKNETTCLKIVCVTNNGLTGPGIICTDNGTFIVCACACVCVRVFVSGWMDGSEIKSVSQSAP